MEERKIEKISKETKSSEDKIENKPLIEQIKELRKFKEEVNSQGIKKRKIKIPRKAKVGKRKLKKQWMGILRVDENRNITGERQRVSGNAFKTSDGTYHEMNGDEVLFWQGKYPILIQFSNKTRPYNINVGEQMKENETFGDRYKMAKMLSDTIKMKSKGGNSIIIWILVAGAVLFGINALTKGGLFG